VFTTEPADGNPLLDFFPRWWDAASRRGTAEAQEKAGTQGRQSVRLALAREFVPDAVNVQGGTVDEDVKPALPLAEKLGRIFTAWPRDGRADRRGGPREIRRPRCPGLQLAALKGVFTTWSRTR